MDTKKIIKKTAIGLLIIGVLLFVITVYHIATKKPLDNATVQISRIDFDKPFDSAGAVEIEKVIKTIPGVKSDVIVVRNVVVYYHEKKIANSKKVYDQLMAKGNYKAQRFLIPDSIVAKSVCPVMDEDSFNYKFSQFVQRIFN